MSTGGGDGGAVPDPAADRADAAGGAGGAEDGAAREPGLAERIDALAALFERRILDDRDKRRLLDEARDGPYRQYLHPLVHRLALLIDRLDREAGGIAPTGPQDTGAAPGTAGGAEAGAPASGSARTGADHADDGETGNEVAVGLARSVRDELLDALAAHGVREVRTTGPFDPARQEAVSVDRDSGAEPGSVTAVVRRGFAHGDWVFRPARVTVAAPARRD
ncbi:nucleotide exchange factor GrpE [Streptomyces bohaiensis]|uniref:Nucleotide exchange factor GrpE n=1 Tax=Streptomyces bohaiensis TaxID=1431344 RepID=A0ABX1CDD9_9ACTN|nr:nucleotide exchange factor GrpE [Streptomyces bohaiensis]NJQ17108.1 nucleotide exchange factor GrpE [Streptomyces bohaiensis]